MATSHPLLSRSPALWAKATRQPPITQRLANRLSLAKRNDPGSWATLAREAAFYLHIGEPNLATMFSNLSALAKRRARIVSYSRGTSLPTHTDPTMASEWTLNNRTFAVLLLRRGTTIIEKPYNPKTLSTTHNLYHDSSTNRFILLTGPPTHWPTANLVHPAKTPAPLAPLAHNG